MEIILPSEIWDKIIHYITDIRLLALTNKYLFNKIIATDEIKYWKEYDSITIDNILHCIYSPVKFIKPYIKSLNNSIICLVSNLLIFKYLKKHKILINVLSVLENASARGLLDIVKYCFELNESYVNNSISVSVACINNNHLIISEFIKGGFNNWQSVLSKLILNGEITPIKLMFQYGKTYNIIVSLEVLILSNNYNLIEIILNNVIDYNDPNTHNNCEILIKSTIQRGLANETMIKLIIALDINSLEMLLYSADVDNLYMMILLVDNGININVAYNILKDKINNDNVLKLFDHYCYVPLPVSYGLFVRSYENRCNNITSIIIHQYPNYIKKYNYNALYAVILDNNADLIAKFIKFVKPIIINISLNFAIKNNKYDCVSILIEHIDNINLFNPLILACKNNSPTNIVDKLLSYGANVKLNNNKAIRLAAINNNRELLHLLYCNDANIHVLDDYIWRKCKDKCPDVFSYIYRRPLIYNNLFSI